MPFLDPEERRRYQREWCARRRAAFFDGLVCESCGSSRRLELHHRDPREKVAHAIWSWSQARRDTEIAKCVVLCDTCHDERHREAKRTFATFRARDEAGRFVPIEREAA